MSTPSPISGPPHPAADPIALDRILHAYRESQVLITSARLGLFDALDPDGRPVPLAVIAAAGGVAPERCFVLCEGLVGLGLLIEEGDGYVAGPLAAAHLVPDASYPLGHWVASEQTKYVGFAGLAEALRADPAADDEERLNRRRRGLSAAQHQGLGEVARARTPETLRALCAVLPDAPSRAGRLLDAGGGHGMDAIGVLSAWPSWTAVLADRTDATRLAAENAAGHGVAARFATRTVDLETDDLGEGYDVAFLFLVLGGKPAEEALAVLRNVWAALRPGGWVLIRGNWTDRLRAATSALKHMLRPGGRATMSPERLLELIGQAGFAEAHLVAADGVTERTVVAARRPK